MFKRISFLLVLLLGLALTSCQSRDDPGFGVYLLAQDVPTADLAQMDIRQLRLQDQPLFSSDDIVSYDAESHTIELTQAAYTRLQRVFPMPVRVAGIPFVVCVGEERIYTGALWTPVSSLSYEGVIIMQPLNTSSTRIQINLGYPAPEMFTGDDPRADPRILKALEQDNKLKENNG